MWVATEFQKLKPSTPNADRARSTSERRKTDRITDHKLSRCNLRARYLCDANLVLIVAEEDQINYLRQELCLLAR